MSHRGCKLRLKIDLSKCMYGGTHNSRKELMCKGLTVHIAYEHIYNVHRICSSGVCAHASLYGKKIQ